MSDQSTSEEVRKEGRFVPPCNDVAFKKVFGDQQRPEALVEFLNSVLELDHPIQRIEIIDPKQPPVIKDLKGTILDIQAYDGTRKFIVEMQLQNESWFAKRVVYYTANAYASQLRDGDNYKTLKPVIFLGVMDFTMFPTGDNPISRHLIFDQKTHDHTLKDIEFNFIELPKFNKTEDQLETLTDQWLFFLKNAAELNEIPRSVTSPVLESAYKTVEHYGLTPEEKRRYDFWNMQEHIRENTIETAKIEGMEKGREKGIKEGMEKGREKGIEEGMNAKAHDMVKNLLAQGVDEQTICQAANLSPTEIANIKQSCIELI